MNSINTNFNPYDAVRTVPGRIYDPIGVVLDKVGACESYHARLDASTIQYGIRVSWGSHCTASRRVKQMARRFVRSQGLKLASEWPAHYATPRGAR